MAPIFLAFFILVAGIPSAMAQSGVGEGRCVSGYCYEHREVSCDHFHSGEHSRMMSDGSPRDRNVGGCLSRKYDWGMTERWKARPCGYFDLVGGSFGGEIKEVHAGKFVAFIPRYRVGAGFTVYSQYDTPFTSRFTIGTVTTTEKILTKAWFPLEVVIAPLNIKSWWGNSVISPQVYMTYSGWGAKAMSRSFHSKSYFGNVFNAKIMEYGLRVPLGALIGFRAGHLTVKSPAQSSADGDYSHKGFSDKKTFFAVDAFLGAMLGIPGS